MWTPVTTITLESHWKFTEPVTGEYFRIKHTGALKNGDYMVARANLLSSGKLETFDARLIKVSESDDIIYFDKKKIFESQRLAIKRILPLATIEDELRRIISSSFLKKQALFNSSQFYQPWKVEIEKSSITEPTSVTGSSGGTQKTLTFQSNGDTNGVCYWIGTNYGTETWQNPHTAGKVYCQRSSNEYGQPSDLVNRTAGQNSHTNSIANSWLTIDLGITNKLKINYYTLQERGMYGGHAIRNWKLQGCNNAISNTIADLNAATWEDIDIRVNDATMANTVNSWGSYAVNNSNTAYRWFRILQNGVTAGNMHYLTVAEIELYGLFTKG